MNKYNIHSLNTVHVEWMDVVFVFAIFMSGCEARARAAGNNGPAAQLPAGPFLLASIYKIVNE